MAELVFTAIMSIDGYMTDANGNFDWAEPDEEVHRFVNERERDIGTHLLGRRMYEVMAYWGTDEATTDKPEFEGDYAKIWQGAEKIVYSTTLESVSSAKTTLERSLDLDALRALKESAGHRISISGPTLAHQALVAGVVDAVELYVYPVIVGGGLAAFPAGHHLRLEMVEEHRFAGGVVYLRYRTITT
ncbi:MAG: dihydrofolate reductase family protein [Thermomicrobiales bacterium]